MVDRLLNKPSLVVDGYHKERKETQKRNPSRETKERYGKLKRKTRSELDQMFHARGCGVEQITNAIIGETRWAIYKSHEKQQARTKAGQPPRYAGG